MKELDLFMKGSFRFNVILRMKPVKASVCEDRGFYCIYIQIWNVAGGDKFLFDSE